MINSAMNIEVLCFATLGCVLGLLVFAAAVAAVGSWHNEAMMRQEDKYCDFLDAWSAMRKAGVPMGVRKILAQQDFGKAGTTLAQRARVDTDLADMKMMLGALAVERQPPG